MRVERCRRERIACRPLSNDLTRNQKPEARGSIVLIEISDRHVVPAGLPLILEPGSTLVLPCTARNRLTAGRSFPGYNLLYVVSVQLHGIGINFAGIIAGSVIVILYSLMPTEPVE